MTFSLLTRMKCTVHPASNSANNVGASSTTTTPRKLSGCSYTGRTHRYIRHKLVSRDGFPDFPDVRDVSQETFGSISTSQFPASSGVASSRIAARSRSLYREWRTPKFLTDPLGRGGT